MRRLPQSSAGSPVFRRSKARRLQWAGPLRCAALAGGLAVGIALAGCSSVVVESQPLGQAEAAGGGEAGGLVYSLPKTILTVVGTQDAAKKISYTITPSIMPDPRARFRLRYTASSFADDDLALSIDRNGLLTSTRADTTDQTGAIAVQLAKAAEAATLLGRAPPTLATPAPPADVYPFTRIYDAEEFAGGKADSVVDLPLPDGNLLQVQNWRPADEPLSISTDCTRSVCFRTLVPMRVSVVRDRNSQPLTEFEFVAIDPFRTEGIDLRTAALVTRKNTVTFDSGLVTSVAINKPSSALAIASLPLAIIKAVLSVPSELLTLRISNVNNQDALAKAQTGLLTDQPGGQLASIAAQDALVKAQTALAADTKAKNDALDALKNASTGAQDSVAGVGKAP